MRVLYLSQYFPPEVGATQTRAYEMSRYLVAAGHQVTMITEVPNHPSGRIPPDYRGKLFECTRLDGIDVIRVWVKASPAKTFRNRMLFYNTYMLNAALAGLIRARVRHDVLFATSPPLFVGGAALALSFLRRIPMVFEVRDLWPESAVALGEITNPRAVALAGKLEEKCYNRARRIVVVTRGIQRRLEERGFGAKVTLIPNGSNTELFHCDAEAGQALRADLGLSGKFVVLYAGVHGIAQALETVLRAAREFLPTPEVHFLFVGEGPRKAELLGLRDAWGLANVTMLGERPRAQMPAFLSAADLALVPLRKLSLFEGAVPSKMFDAWACSCPVLLSIDGEARSVMEEAQGGAYVEPEDAEAMVQVIRELMTEPDRRHQMGENGRRFVERNYSRERLAARLEALLQDIIRMRIQ